MYKTNQGHTKKQSIELGFGKKNTVTGQRLINKNGSFNVSRKGLTLRDSFDFYHMFINMSWWRFLLLIGVFYITINLLFACIYMALGVEQLDGIRGETPFEKFYEAFFFSAQTVTTLGYGRISPVGFWASVIAAIESMMGLLVFALATGLLYGRFSKPKPRILFSKQALIAPYYDIKSFEFRLANPKPNILVEAEVNVTYSYIDEHSKLRRFEKLDLEYNKINLFSLAWTVVHPISSNKSPIYGLDEATFKNRDAEFIVFFKAFDVSFGQVVYSRFSYKWDELKWNEKFESMIEAKENKNHIILDFDKFHCTILQT